MTIWAIQNNQNHEKFKNRDFEFFGQKLSKMAKNRQKKKFWGETFFFHLFIRKKVVIVNEFHENWTMHKNRGHEKTRGGVNMTPPPAV